MIRKRLHERKRIFHRYVIWSGHWLDKQASAYQTLRQSVASDKNRVELMAYVAAKVAKKDYTAVTDGDYPVPYDKDERTVDLSGVPASINVKAAMKDNGKGEPYLLHRHYHQISEKVFSYDLPDRFDPERSLLHLFYTDDEILALIDEQTKILNVRIKENEETMRGMRARVFQELAHRRAMIHH